MERFSWISPLAIAALVVGLAVPAPLAWAAGTTAIAPLPVASNTASLDRAAPLTETPAPQRTLRLEEIRIHGNKRISDESIRSRIRLEPGDPVDVDVFEEARQRLLATGYFDDVDFSTRPGSSRGAGHRCPLATSVRSGPTGRDC